MKRLWSVLGFGVCGCLSWLGCSDTHDHPERSGERSGTGGIPSPCPGVPSTTPLAWDEMSELQVSPREAFGALAGSCQAPFSWDGSRSGLSIAPPSGASQIDVSVQIDEDSARLLDPPGAVMLPGCDTYLEVDADLQIESDDGVFADGERVTLRYHRLRGVEAISFKRSAEELGGSLRIETRPKQQASLEYRASGAGNACAGEILLSSSETQGNAATASTGWLGKWSNTGCPLGKEALPLDGSSERGKKLLQQIAERVGDVTYPGVWDDGSETNLHLSVAVDATPACAESGPRSADLAEVPIRVSYGSDDGRISMHTTTDGAHANVGLSEDGSVSYLQLLFSESMTCAEPDDALPYTRASCGTSSSVLAQLLLNLVGVSIRPEGTLGFYTYDGPNMGGAASRFEELRLDPSR